MDDFHIKAAAAAEHALEEIKKRAPEQYSMLDADPDSKNKISQAAEATARETFMLTYKLGGNPEDIQKLLDKHLSNERITLLKGGLKVPTFQMDIRKVDGKHWLNFTREGQEFLPSKVLERSDDVDWGIIQQYASIWIRAVLLVMSSVGIPISLRTEVIKKTVDKTAKAIKSSLELRSVLKAFVEAWNAADNKPMKMAAAFFDLLKDINAAEILWIIIESLCSSMEWYDWLLIAVKVIAMIFVTIATDGAVLIAEIALVVLSAVDLITKIDNVFKLFDIKKKM